MEIRRTTGFKESFEENSKRSHIVKEDPPIQTKQISELICKRIMEQINKMKKCMHLLHKYQLEEMQVDLAERSKVKYGEVIQMLRSSLHYQARARMIE